jgi:hypothetical protein
MEIATLRQRVAIIKQPSRSTVSFAISVATRSSGPIEGARVSRRLKIFTSTGNQHLMPRGNRRGRLI